MRMGILAIKVGMTQIFDETGAVVPVTVLDASGCYITQVKTKQKEGYNALQVGLGKRKPQNVKKVAAGHFKKAGVAATAKIKEMRLSPDDNLSHLTAGTALSVSMFAKGDRVDAIALSRGLGFQGVMKRHGYHGADASHGVHEYFRHGGSNGTNTFPGRTLKLKGMPGRMGGDKVTVPNLLVVDVREKENLIFVRGAVPGFKSNPVLLRIGKKAKNQPTDRKWTSA